MLKIHRNADRGAVDHGWLKSNHSFSFGHYYNPEQLGFGPLLVINEDRVQPSKGFATHSHSNMEIISYVISGALEHKDSMGTVSVIRYGDVQRMSAGTGVSHSEFNHSLTENVHFLQIWIEPNVKDIDPSYEEAHFDEDQKKGKFLLIASPDGADGSVKIHQNAFTYNLILDGDDKVVYPVIRNRPIYAHLVKGEIVIHGLQLTTGDGLKVNDEEILEFTQGKQAELLLFDLPY